MTCLRAVPGVCYRLRLLHHVVCITNDRMNIPARMDASRDCAWLLGGCGRGLPVPRLLNCVHRSRWQSPHPTLGELKYASGPQ